MSVYFISGIDTDIGKSIAVGMMARYLHQFGVKVITMKLVQTGNDGFSEDLNKHRSMMNVAPFPEDAEGLTAPQIFSFPASPHLAASLEKRTLDLDAIRRAVAELAKRYEVVLLEGAGGLAVPLNEELLTVDFVSELGSALILVTSGRLGSLNHTILSLEAAKNRGIAVAGVIYNRYPAADPIIDADSPRMIRKYLKRYRMPEAIVELPEIKEPYVNVDFSPIFGDKTK
ncbi:MAG: dethiobiotin synthase [Victivallales bacterium]|jgi:dethiobiotin synthetase|nr:dethiobiotin synthase [Victivallales bacterium]